jgi:hypothetical protein
MKKIIVLVAAALLLLPMSAMAGMTAFMDMDKLSDVELAATTGQAGITINATAQVLGGYISWGDEDGYAAISASSGWLILNNITVSGLVLDGTTIDICTPDGGPTWLVIGVPGLTITAGLEVLLSPVRTPGDALEEKLGDLYVGGLQLAGMTLQISGH